MVVYFQSTLPIKPLGKIHVMANFIPCFLIIFTCLIMWFSKLYTSWACFKNHEDVMSLCERTTMVRNWKTRKQFLCCPQGDVEEEGWHFAVKTWETCDPSLFNVSKWDWMTWSSEPHQRGKHLQIFSEQKQLHLHLRYWKYLSRQSLSPWPPATKGANGCMVPSGDSQHSHPMQL